MPIPTPAASAIGIPTPMATTSPWALPASLEEVLDADALVMVEVTVIIDRLPVDNAEDRDDELVAWSLLVMWNGADELVDELLVAAAAALRMLLSIENSSLMTPM
jgi:hypothetical protein